MTNDLERLAVDADPTEDIRAAVFARHERTGAKLSFLLVAVVTISFGAAGWPVWLGGVIGGVLASAGYSLMCDNYVLVVCGHQIRIHRPRTLRWHRVPLGSFDRVVGTDSLRAGRKGPFNDTWWVDGVKMHVEKDLSKPIVDLLERQPNAWVRNSQTASSHQPLKRSTSPRTT